MHKRLCHEYCKCKSKAAADTVVEAIKAWWYSSSGVSEIGLKEMNDWLNFWHFLFHQWGSFTSEIFFEVSLIAYYKFASCQTGEFVVIFIEVLSLPFSALVVERASFMDFWSGLIFLLYCVLSNLC